MDGDGLRGQIRTNSACRGLSSELSLSPDFALQRMPYGMTINAPFIVTVAASSQPAFGLAVTRPKALALVSLCLGCRFRAWRDWLAATAMVMSYPERTARSAPCQRRFCKLPLARRGAPGTSFKSRRLGLPGQDRAYHRRQWQLRSRASFSSFLMKFPLSIPGPLKVR